MKPERIVVAGLLCLVLVASPAYAASGQAKQSQSQSLSLTLLGLITNAGSQHYEFGGGDLVQGSLFHQQLTSAKVSFDIDATVHGVQGASGSGSIEISTGDGHGNQGDHSSAQANDENGDHKKGVDFSAHISVTGVIQAAIFPFTDITVNPPTINYKPCNPSSGVCNSEIPLFFTGTATVESEEGHDQPPIPIAIESPYWNPFGGPIVITSLDSTKDPIISLVVSYDRATIDWDGVQLAGNPTIYGGIEGNLGTETVAGTFSQGVSSQENLMTGRESDTGTIAFAGMTDPVLDAQGRFSGHTTFSITPENSFDCTSLFPGLPKGPNWTTCTATGATSTGDFHMSADHGVHITGTYSTIWSAPSLFTLTAVIGALTQH